MKRDQIGREVLPQLSAEEIDISPSHRTEGSIDSAKSLLAQLPSLPSRAAAVSSVHERLLLSSSPQLGQFLVDLADTVNSNVQAPPVAVNYARLGAFLCRSECLQVGATGLLIAAIAALERYNARRGPQLRSKTRALSVAYNTAKRELRGNQKCVYILLDVLESGERPIYRTIAAIGMLAGLHQGLSIDHRRRFILGATTVCTGAHVLNAGRITKLIAQSISQVDHDFVVDKVVPLIGKSLLRTPEVSLPAAALLLRASPADLSPCATKMLLPAVAQAVKSGNVETRSGGEDLAGVLGSRLKETDALVAGISMMGTCLNTAKYAYQKISSIQAICNMACASVIRDSPVRRLDGTLLAVDVMLEWLIGKKKANDDVWDVAIAALVKLVSVALADQSDSSALPVMRRCAQFFLDVLNAQSHGADSKALLVGMTANLPESALSRDFFGESGISALQSTIRATFQRVNESCLRAVAVHCEWAYRCSSKGSRMLTTQVDEILRDNDSMETILKGTPLTTVNAVECVLSCCRWIIIDNPSESKLPLATAIKMCLDPRVEISSVALRFLQKLRKQGVDAEMMFMTLWETEFCGFSAESGVAKSNVLDDGMIGAERLGRILKHVVVGNVPETIIPLALMAANHPRLVPPEEHGCIPPKSRHWSAIEKCLKPVQVNVDDRHVEDWLERCLVVIWGPDGLRHKEQIRVTAALNALGALADFRNEYSHRVVERSVKLLVTVLSKATEHGQHAAAHGSHSDADEPPPTFRKTRTEPRASGLKKAAKATFPTAPVEGISDYRMNVRNGETSNRCESEIPGESEAEGAHRSAALARKARQDTHTALRAVQRLTRVASKSMRRSIPELLPLILPLASLHPLQTVSREALFSLTSTASRPLLPLSMDICATLTHLEQGPDNACDRICAVLRHLESLIPPALEVEEFSLIIPIIRSALVGSYSGPRRPVGMSDWSTAAKLSAQLLAEHCKPQYKEAAFAAAACRAGCWVLEALEREDCSFHSAADALSLLAASALAVGADPLDQILEGIASGKASVRDAVLNAIARLPQLSPRSAGCPHDGRLGCTLWFGRFDPDNANAQLADDLWTRYAHPLRLHEDLERLMALLANDQLDIRKMSARAIAAALPGEENTIMRKATISQILDTYKTQVRLLASRGNMCDSTGLRQYGHLRGSKTSELLNDSAWPIREGVALAIEHLAASGALDVIDLRDCFDFLCRTGFVDSNKLVTIGMRRAAAAVVIETGPDAVSLLLPLMKLYLDKASRSSAKNDPFLEQQREQLVMCLGLVSEHLSSHDSLQPEVLSTLLKHITATTSAAVQDSAARSLSILLLHPQMYDRLHKVTEPLLESMSTENIGYWHRRGCAYAIGGICKGLGLRGLKLLQVLEHIRKTTTDKSPHIRRGGLLLIEAHSSLLGHSFEPYAIACLPLMLSCMNDSSTDVRNACWTSARASMSEISSQGVKMLLPTLLRAFNDRQWRTKSGSAELLGAMAFCAPRQLSQCLPQIVPVLAEALADAHPRVVNSAESALNRIVAVVKCPEVRMLSPFLLSAFRDPAGKTRGAVEAILDCEFTHSIDAASLALLIPPVYRGLRDRSAELKKKSAAIVGSMCGSVSNHRDVVPYLDMLLPALQVTLLDSIPESREASARALGAVASSLGVKEIPSIVPWLLSTLFDGNCDSVADEPHCERRSVIPRVIASSAERSGAALGLAAVAASMDHQSLESILCIVLDGRKHSTRAKEGGLLIIASLPQTLGDRFESKLRRAFSVTLQGLSDDADSVREAALRAGRSLVSAYAKTSLDQVLPVLLSAMRDRSWRIRSAATRLLGNMLSVIAGASTRPTGVRALQVEAATEDDAADTAIDQELGHGELQATFDSPEQATAALTTNATMQAIETTVGKLRHRDMLASLYIVRCDVSSHVRQTGMQVWKMVVSNTPRVLKEIMPSIVLRIVNGLADEDEERRAALAKALADISQKLGSHVVPEVLPPLSAAIRPNNGSERTRRGACDGLRELVLACPRQQLEEHISDLTEAVYIGLCDGMPSVRGAAADVFSLLLRSLGKSSIEHILSRFMDRLTMSEEESEQAILALDQIVSRCGSHLMATVLPWVLERQPLGPGEARLLATAASRCDAAFEQYASDVTNAALCSIAACADSCLLYIVPVLSAVASRGGRSVHAILDEFLVQLSTGSREEKLSVAKVCGPLLRNSDKQVASFLTAGLLPSLIQRLSDVEVAHSVTEALVDLCVLVPPEDLAIQIPTIRKTFKNTSSLCTKEGAINRNLQLHLSRASAFFVTAFANGLLHGEIILREQAALGIGEYMHLCTERTTPGFMIRMVGPMIRVMSERYQWQVKVAVLNTLTEILQESPQVMRTFAPQLQSVFVRCLCDSNHVVRTRAVAALGALSPILTRLEGLLTHLTALTRKEGRPQSRVAALQSCREVFSAVDPLPAVVVKMLPTSLVLCLADPDENVRMASGLVLESLAGRVGGYLYLNLLNLVVDRVTVDRGGMEQVAAVKSAGAILSAGRCLKGLEEEQVTSSVDKLFVVLGGADPSLLSAGCATCACMVQFLSDIAGEHESIQSRRLRMMKKICEIAECSSYPAVRVSALQAIGNFASTDAVSIETTSRTLVLCASDDNPRIRNQACKAIRRAFIHPVESSLNLRHVQAARRVLDETHQAALDRHLNTALSQPA